MTACRRQYTYRLAALLAATMLAPLHASATAGGMRAMGEAELSAVSARGLTDDLLHPFNAPVGGNKVIGTLSSSLDKGLRFFDLETTLTDVSYDPVRAKTFLNSDGSITQILPSSIGEVRFDDIRVKGAAPGASFGSISIRAVDLTGTSLILAPR